MEQPRQIACGNSGNASVAPAVNRRQYNTELSGSAQAVLGDHFGDVHHHHYPPLVEHADILPSPTSTVPFRRDADYIDRGDLLTQIEQKCAQPAARVALVGIGGVGKSQLAIEYCHRLRERDPETWVFWIYASTTERLAQGFREIAEEAEISGRDNPQADIPDLVRKWLRKENQRWLIVLDNLDDDAVLTLQREGESAGAAETQHQQSLLLSNYLPQTSNGSLLITTRTLAVALQLVEPRDTIQVGPMTNKEATALLARKLDDHSDDNDLNELATVLEFMPLAIIQAAAYIQRRAPRCSVREYINQFSQNDQARTGLLGYEAGHLRRDREAKNSIINTWQMSFDHIRKKRPSAADLLSLMSFFDRQGIPEYILTARVDPQQAPDDGTLGTENVKFDTDISTLRDYLLISVESDGHTFAMHRLVQLATRDWLVQHGKVKRQQAVFLKKLERGLQSSRKEIWTKYEQLMPHVRAAESMRPDHAYDDRALFCWGRILYHGTYYACMQYHYADAEKLCLRSAAALEHTVQNNEVEILSLQAMLALIHAGQGRWQQAEEQGLEVVKMHQLVLGNDSSMTLGAMSNLVIVYLNQGREREAEALQLEVVERRKRIWGENHRDTLHSMSDLANIYLDQGRPGEAEAIQAPLVPKLKRICGEDKLETLTAAGVLAKAFLDQDRPQQAELLLEEILETKRRVLGDEHPSTITTLLDLACAYTGQNRLDEAEALIIRAYEARRRSCGENNPLTLNAMYRLGLVLACQGRLEEAIVLFTSCKQLSVKFWGPTHGRMQSIDGWLEDWQARLAHQNDEQTCAEDSSGPTSNAERHKPGDRVAKALTK